MAHYRTKQETIAIAGTDDLVICSLLDRQQFWDPHGEAERLGISSATWPLFGMLWPSGAQLAARLAARPVSAAERILEIGCGLALASLVGHRRGADITASDCHPLAETFLQENLRLNGLPPLPYQHGQWGVPGEPLDLLDEPSQLHPLHPPEAPRRNVHGRYHLLIASDVLYEPDREGGLAQFIGQHAMPAAEVWIVDPDRGNRGPFNRGMAALGFTLREERLDCAATAAQLAYKGRLLIYQRDARARLAAASA